MRRLTQLLRTGMFFIVAMISYALIRWQSVAGEGATRFPDSLGYEHLTFIGVNERLWSVPLAYSIAHTSHQRVVAHVLIGTAVWAYLTWRIGLLTRWRKSVMTMVFAIGLAPQVVHYDLAILSESLGISFAVGAVAATLHVVQSPHRLAKVSWVIFVTLTAFTRPTHLIVLYVCALYCIAVYVLSRRKKRRTSAIFLASLSLWGFMQYRGNESQSMVNFYTVLQRRVIADDSAYKWFIKQGMPEISGIKEAHGYGRADQLDPAVREFIGLPIRQLPPMSMVAGGLPLAKWARKDGWNTYTKFLVSHPSSIGAVLSRRTSQTLSPADESFLPTHSHPIVPRAIFDPWWAWLLILVSSLTITWFSRARAIVARALTATTLVAGGVFVISLLMSAIEYERHTVTSAVILRVLALASFAAATEGAKTTKNDESSGERDSSFSRGTRKT